MMAGTIETAGEGESDREGLRGSPVNAPTQGVLGDTMACERSKSFRLRAERMLANVVIYDKLSEKPTAVVG